MKLGNTLKNVLGAGLLAGLCAVAPLGHAATATTTIDVNFPSVVVMYHYDTITLQVDQTALANYMAGGAAACGGDFCDNLTGTLDLTGSPVTDLSGAPVSVDANVNPPAPPATAVPVTVQNAVGVRALGCSTYTATVTDGGSDVSMTVDTVNSLSTIDGAGCSLGLALGDLIFTMDVSQVTGGSDSALFDISIVGNP